MRWTELQLWGGGLVIAGALVGCARSPAPVSRRADPDIAAGECRGPPPGLGGDLQRPLTISPCALDLEPPGLDRVARERALATIEALGPADPSSLALAIEVAASELAAIAWEGLDEARLRATVASLASLVDAEAHASSRVRDSGLMALACAHALLGEAEPARTRGLELLRSHSGQWAPAVYLVEAELRGGQAGAIALYEKSTRFDAVAAYAKYRLAWALRQPTLVDRDRAIGLLAEVLADPGTSPRLGRALRQRAALELRALGRAVAVPAAGCAPADGAAEDE